MRSIYVLVGGILLFGILQGVVLAGNTCSHTVTIRVIVSNELSLNENSIEDNSESLNWATDQAAKKVTMSTDSDLLGSSSEDQLLDDSSSSSTPIETHAASPSQDVLLIDAHSQGNVELPDVNSLDNGQTITYTMTDI